jgi:ribonuclease E
MRRRSAEICIYVPTTVALYVLNQKRDSLGQIESRYGLKVMIARDDALIPPAFRLERLRAFGAGEAPPAPRSIQAPTLAEDEEMEEEEEAESHEAAGEAADTAEREADDERGRRRRRRRRRRGDEARDARQVPAGEEGAEADARPAPGEEEPQQDQDSEAERRRRRRGRRGGRPRARRDEADRRGDAEPVAAETIEVVPTSEGERVDREPVTMPDPDPWPGNAGIEAASLAPLAGDAGEPAPHHVEPETNPAPAPTAESEQGFPFVSGPERRFETAEAMPQSAAARSDFEEAGPAGQTSDGPDGSGTPPHPADDVQTITEKPANPRRGWWQRLMNP